jgi:hypothetical protein
MKIFFKIYTLTLSIILIILYLLVWIDLIGNYPNKSFLDKFTYSFEYFVTNGLPYWWFLILIFSIVISSIIFLVLKLVNRKVKK